MICSSCNKNIPNSSIMCNHCHAFTNVPLSTNKAPHCDMYNNPIKVLHPDTQKQEARYNQMKKIKEYGMMIALDETKKRKKVFGFLSPFALFIGAFFVFLPLCILLSIYVLDSSVLIPIAMLLTFIVPVSFYFKNTKKNDKKNEIIESQVRNLDRHNNKLILYYNDNIFGYSILNNSASVNGSIRNFYTFHEIDKKDIKTITYDSKHAEYILNISKPLYTDFRLPPSTEFRFPDIFDDTILSVALEQDLPPKDMHF